MQHLPKMSVFRLLTIVSVVCLVLLPVPVCSRSLTHNNGRHVPGQHRVAAKGPSIPAPQSPFKAQKANNDECTEHPAAIDCTYSGAERDFVVEPASRALSVRAGGSVQDEKEYSRAVVKTLLSVASACAFGIGLYKFSSPTASLEFFSGYLVEQSLSVDNLFVFILLFDYFKVPAQLQPLVLSWGIWGAIGMRGVMILAGVKALEKARVVLLFFAGILVISGAKLFQEGIKGHEEEESMEDNMVLKIANFLVPSTPKYDGSKFFTVDKKTGKKLATPLLTCLICIELSDFVFAVDSIPAVLGVTKDPVIVYASNIFAIMALRSLYSVVAKAVDDLVYLKPAVAAVLSFVGAKMAAEYYHIEISTEASLAVVGGLLSIGVGGSMLMKNKKNHK